MVIQVSAVEILPAPEALENRLDSLLREVDMTRKMLRLAQRKQKYFGGSVASTNPDKPTGGSAHAS